MKKYTERVEEILAEGVNLRGMDKAVDLLVKAGVAVDTELESDGVSESGRNKFDKDMMKIKNNIAKGVYK